MKPYNVINQLAPSKRKFAGKLLRGLLEVDGVCSATLVGSFCDRDEFAEISDIDTVVICEELSLPLFDRCLKIAEGADGADLGIPDKKVFVNPSFGPLKFDTDDQFVVHLMAYDVEGHRRHVLKSPFTCYDWERSQIYVGRSLREIYPVLNLQISDFLKARRGLANYLDDLEKGILSYRDYEFRGDQAEETVKYRALDKRQRGEYTYHIVKTLVTNYAKFLMRENRLLNREEFYIFWRENLPRCSFLIPWFQELEVIKLRRKLPFPSDTLAQVKTFLSLFSEEIQSKWASTARRIIFMRHARSHLNDGSFLGQGRDPGVLEKAERLDEKFECVFASPLKRSLETSAMLQPGCPVRIDSRLTEQNYGDAEGFTYEQLRDRYPEIVRAWNRAEDPCFPGGESLADVEKRIFAFLGDLSTSSNFPVLVVTHNVVIRCLLGRLLGIERQHWYRLKPNHLEAFEVITSNCSIYINLDPDQRARIADSLVRYSEVAKTSQSLN